MAAKKNHADPMYLLKFSARYGSEYLKRNGIMLRDKYPDSWTQKVKAAFEAEYRRLKKEERKF